MVELYYIFKKLDGFNVEIWILKHDNLLVTWYPGQMVGQFHSCINYHSQHYIIAEKYELIKLLSDSKSLDKKLKLARYFPINQHI